MFPTRESSRLPFRRSALCSRSIAETSFAYTPNNRHTTVLSSARRMPILVGMQNEFMSRLAKQASLLDDSFECSGQPRSPADTITSVSGYGPPHTSSYFKDDSLDAFPLARNVRHAVSIIATSSGSPGRVSSAARRAL